MFRDLCPALANKTYLNYGGSSQEPFCSNGFQGDRIPFYQRFYQRLGLPIAA